MPHPGQRALAKPQSKYAVIGEPPHGLGDVPRILIGVGGVDHEGTGLVDGCRRSAAITDDEGKRVGHGLELDVASRFAVAREDKHVSTSVEGVNLRSRQATMECDPVSEAKAGDEFLACLPVRPVTNDVENYHQVPEVSQG